MSMRYFSKAEMQEIDQMVIHNFHISPFIMLENAGKSLAVIAREVLKKNVYNKNILVLVGKGNNGAGGLIASRHLSNWGANVEVLSFFPSNDLKTNVKSQLQIIDNMKISITNNINNYNYDLIIDAIFGCNFKPPSSIPMNNIINRINESKIFIMSLDLPSCLDADDGIVNDVTIKSNLTLTLGFPKKGLFNLESRKYVGELYLADISIPNAVYSKFGINSNEFFSKTFISKLNY